MERHDIDTVVAFLDEAWRTYYRGIIADDALDNLDSTWRRNLLAERIDSGGVKGLLQHDGAELIGVCIYGAASEDLFPDDAELEALYVAPEHLGEGLGSRLMAQAEAELHQQGYANIFLFVFAENTRAIAFYERHGYAQVTGDLSQQMGWELAPAFAMRKSLTTEALLAAAGWFPGRQVDTTEIEAALAADGVEMTEAGRALIAEFDGLEVANGRYPIVLSALSAVRQGEGSAAATYSEVIGERVVPLGCYSHMTYWADEQGAIWGSYAPYYGRLADSLPEAIADTIYYVPGVSPRLDREIPITEEEKEKIRQAREENIRKQEAVARRETLTLALVMALVALIVTAIVATAIVLARAS
ncbi:MAG: GNAT family N-acetyltransferase [Propionibacteriaceae bacterium]|jgi:ribosomal protein S18 acetylase RimI-like enzyme|nr:GNAT family N-acetyltransferase [Propionibacteriaceae bacterium]